MKKSDEYKYILFPLPLLQEIFKKPKNGFDIIFDVGIYKVAGNINIKADNAIKQVMYCYYRAQKELTKSILSKLNKLVSGGIITPDEDYNGFTRTNLTASINGNPTLSTLENIANALNVEVTELFDRKGTFTALIDNGGVLLRFDSVEALEGFISELKTSNQ